MSPTSYQAAPPRIRTATIGPATAGVKRAARGDRRGARGVRPAPAVQAPPIANQASGLAGLAGPRARRLRILLVLAILRASDRARVSSPIAPLARRSDLNRLWTRALPGLSAALLLAASPGTAGAAAEVHKFNLVINASPSEIVAGDFNDVIDNFNHAVLIPRGLESLEKVRYGWFFGAELRYLIRPNFALSAGIDQMRTRTRREYSFSPVDNLSVEAQVLTAPIHLGGTYYLAPYNQGDFQARAYIGGGLLSLTSTHASITTVVALGSTPSVPQGTFESLAAGDAPGWYTEFGAHLFFAVRYSVILGAIYRSALVGTTAQYFNGQLLFTGSKQTIDVGGAGARMSFAIGF